MLSKPTRLLTLLEKMHSGTRQDIFTGSTHVVFTLHMYSKTKSTLQTSNILKIRSSYSHVQYTCDPFTIISAIWDIAPPPVIGT